MTIRVVELIERKREGGKLNADEISALVLGYAAGDVPDYQMAAFCMAVVWRGMDAAETAALTAAMVQSGERLDLSRFGRVVDKHSTGGVGDKTTLVVAPLVAACGAPVAKMSGRGLGFSGGTLDKLESIRGYRVDLTTAEFLAQLERIGIVVTGQTADLAPADGKMYALRDATGTVPAIPLIASSVMSKKIAVGAHAVVLDVKVGSGAFMKDLRSARELARAMVAIGVAHGLAVTCELTDMEQPLGRAVGNSLEIAEAIAALHGEGPPDLIQLTRVAGAEMLVRARRVRDTHAGLGAIDRALGDGSGFAKLRELVAAQGGDVSMVDDPTKLPRAPHVQTLRAPRTAYVAAIAADQVGIASVHLGAGREKKGDPIDHRTGIVLHAKVGDRVERGQPYADVHAAGKPGDADAVAMVRDAYRWSARRVPRRRLILGRIASR
ncbi:MAG TPA: thymidine phosphorylase [Candidatus Limnocylindria bacterium]|nr:thymidine phosphorylase [Candidatus Limnocylindria bacterium]HEV8470548.1 thymidine phosphorylase [Candidatus Limnocylindria bacterium]